jgi:hypothetical protein
MERIWAIIVAALGGMTLVQITPIKINPWSWLGHVIGQVINGDVLKELQTVKANQQKAQEKLENHIALDDERNADDHRTLILQFNRELLRDVPHTLEDFIEILTVIDKYNKYCDTHKDYPNSRAVHAISNIERVYDDRLQKHDFANPGGEL